MFVAYDYCSFNNIRSFRIVVKVLYSHSVDHELDSKREERASSSVFFNLCRQLLEQGLDKRQDIFPVQRSCQCFLRCQSLLRGAECFLVSLYSLSCSRTFQTTLVADSSCTRPSVMAAQTEAIWVQSSVAIFFNQLACSVSGLQTQER